MDSGPVTALCARWEDVFSAVKPGSLPLYVVFAFFSGLRNG